MVATVAEGAAHVAPASNGYRRWMISLLTGAFALNLLDRQIINVLAEPIKRDLQLADWQLGALTGLSFALLYSVAALPIARLADRGDRVKVIGAAILAWSVFTAACGAAASFAWLLILRVGVGVGEAGCAPPAQSLIADHYPPQKRSGALGKFALGSPVGAAIGLAAGGLLADTVGWRWTLAAAGLPGVVIGVLVLATLKEPRLHALAPPLAHQPPLAGVLKAMVARRAFVFLTLGAALLSFVNYGAMAFAGSFYLRVHAADITALGAGLGVGPLAVIGVGLGVFGAAAGAAGTFFGGYLGDRLGQRDVRAYALIPAAGSLLGVAGYAAMFLVPQGAVSLALFALPAFAVNLWNGPGTLALQSLAGVRAKATALAVVLFVNSALGLGLGPLLIGALSDVLGPQLGVGEGLRWAVLAGLAAGLLSAACYGLASRSLAGDLAATARDDAAAQV